MSNMLGELSVPFLTSQRTNFQNCVISFLISGAHKKACAFLVFSFLFLYFM